MSEADKRNYRAIKADPVRYAAYRERKRREWANNKPTAASEAERKRIWRMNNPDTLKRLRQGHRAVETALRNGTLTKPDTCSACGEGGKIEAHHHKGYEKEHLLDVVWLCTFCHGKAHRADTREVSPAEEKL